MHRWIVLAFTAALLSACARDAGTAALAASADTVDGVSRLSYPETPAPALPWRLDSLTAIGDALGDDAYQFDQVPRTGLAGTRDGDLLVLDRAGHRVLRYGPDGAHRASYGRRGGGPGELTQPVALASAGDTAWVADFGGPRYTGYPLDGGPPRDVPYPARLGVPMTALVATEAGLIQAFRPLPGMGPGAGGTPAGDQSVPLLRLSTEGIVSDTLWRAPAPRREVVRMESEGRVMVMVAEPSFSPAFRWAVLPDGSVVIAQDARYALSVVGPDGVERLRIRRQPAPRPTTEADREAERDRLREEMGGDRGGVRITSGGSGSTPTGLSGAALLEQRLASMTFADVIPRITALATDARSRIWVGVSEGEPGAVDRIDIYDAEGRLLGELRDVPFPDLLYGGDRAARLVRDELDVQRIVLYQLRTAGDAPPAP